MKVFRLAVLAITWLATIPLLSAAEPAPAATPRPVVDVYHGLSVSDPYRWMEDMQSADFRAWVGQQASYARRQLDAIPGRAALAQRLQALAQATGSVRDMAWGGRRLFYLALDPGRSTWRLMMRDGLQGQPQLVIDPDELAAGGPRLAINEFTPSPDGSLVAVGISAGGSEKSVLHVWDVKARRFLSERIDRVYGGNWTVVWLQDGRRFFYVRAPEGERYNKTRIYLHQLGRPLDQDPAIFGHGLLPQFPFEPGDYSYIRLAPGGRHVVATTVPGVANERHFFVAALSDVLAGRATWRRLATPADQWFRGYLAGHHLYVLSHEAAPRNKVLRLDLDHPDAAPQLVLPPGSAVLEDAAPAHDGLYVTGTEAGVAKLFKLPYGQGAVQEVKLPFAGSIGEVLGHPDRSGVLVRMEGWTQSQRVLAVGDHGSLSHGKSADAVAVSDTGLIAPAPADFSGIETKQIAVSSHDGVRVPMTVIHRQGMALDGTHPTVLNAYGAYGFVRAPRFDAMNLAWLERGGVIAIAHVRGGGEYGEEWHRAGWILTKSNTLLDFVACAEALVRLGYTRPGKLAGTGASAGGLAVGGALTERPDLFSAVNSAVGVSDLLRTELEGTGPANIAEFGSVKNRYQFGAMLSVSPYHRVVDGTAYPAVILTTGINDPRVAAWQPAKLAARLQAASTSGKPVLLRVDMDGGHGMGGTRQQRIDETADVWAFFLSAMGEPGFEAPPP